MPKRTRRGKEKLKGLTMAMLYKSVNDCASVVNKKKFNYESVLAGSETTKAKYKCPKGVDVEMWTITGGAHLPKINAAFTTAVFDFLLAHKK